MQGSLFSFPLPIFTAFLCTVIAVLAARLDLGRKQSAVLFSMLCALFAVQSLLVAVRFGYGVEGFVALQRLLPLFVGPLMYLPFMALIVPTEQFGKLLLRHLGGMMFVTLALQTLPPRLGLGDLVIIGCYLFYATALIWRWWQGPDRLIHARLDVVRNVHRWMLWAAALLIVILLLEVAITVSFVLEKSGQVAAIISYGSILMILSLLGVLLVLPRFLKAGPAKSRPLFSVDTETAKLEAEAYELLTTTKLFLDPELSAQRLAKRLHVPVRKLSSAINDSKGVNVSQYVNGLRLSHAAELLLSSNDSVATIMSQSGFLTRSNFYREFQRLYGQTPAAYRESQSSGVAATGGRA